MKSTLRTLLLVGLAISFSACKSKPLTGISADYAATFRPDVSIGSYYHTRRMSYFYDTQPDSLVTKMATHIFGTQKVVQLLDANAGAGWARVRSQDGEIGFMRFSNLIIVPLEKQPDAPKRKHRN